MSARKNKCPCGSGAAINYILRKGLPAISGYDGPAEVVTSKRTATGQPIVLAKCGTCGKVPMFREAKEGGEAFTWVSMGDLLAEEREFYDIPQAS